MRDNHERLKLCERIIGELRCPVPARGDPDNITVAGCMDRKNCGCELGVACGYEPTTATVSDDEQFNKEPKA